MSATGTRVERRARFRLRFSAALELQRRGQWAHAAQRYRQALEVDPSSADAALLRCKCLLLLGDVGAAAAEAERVEALEAGRGASRSFHATLMRAETLFAAGDFERALKHYRAGCALRPDMRAFVVGAAKCEEVLLGVASSAGVATTQAKSERHSLMPELQRDIRYLCEIAASSLLVPRQRVGDEDDEHCCRPHSHPANRWIRHSRRRPKQHAGGRVARAADAQHDSPWSEAELLALMEGKEWRTAHRGGEAATGAPRARVRPAAQRHGERPRGPEFATGGAATTADGAAAAVERSIAFFAARRKFWAHNDPTTSLPGAAPVAATFRIGARVNPPLPARIAPDSRLLAPTRESALRKAAAAPQQDEQQQKQQQGPCMQPVPPRRPRTTVSSVCFKRTAAPRCSPSSPPTTPQTMTRPAPRRPRSRMTVIVEGASGGERALTPATAALRWADYGAEAARVQRTHRAVAQTVREQVGTALPYEEPLRRGAAVDLPLAGAAFAATRPSSRGPTPGGGSARRDPAGARGEGLATGVAQVDRDEDNSDIASVATSGATAVRGTSTAAPIHTEVADSMWRVQGLVKAGDLAGALRLARKVQMRAQQIGPPTLAAALHMTVGQLLLRVGESAGGIRELSRAIVASTAVGDSQLAARATRALASEYARGDACGADDGEEKADDPAPSPGSDRSDASQDIGMLGVATQVDVIDDHGCNSSADSGDAL